MSLGSIVKLFRIVDEQSKLIGKLATMINEDRKKILELEKRMKRLESKNEPTR